MAVLGCDPPLNVGCLVEAGKGNAGSRNLDTGKHRFYSDFNIRVCKKIYYWVGHQQMYDLERFYGTKVGFYKGTLMP